MSKKATEFQRKAMSRMYRGKEIFKPLNPGWIDENVACVREWVANIFFYRKGDTTIMIDAGYNYDRLAEKMGWLGIDPASIQYILITHQDTDHVGAVEADSPGLFRNAKLYIGEIENRYLTGEVRRKVAYCEIGRLVSGRAEKGAAVVASEYLQATYPATEGFSPRNLRRMRAFYTACEASPEIMRQAMILGWTQNVAILERCDNIKERAWYIRAVLRFGWKKADLLEAIESQAWLHSSLDEQMVSCYTEEKETSQESESDEEDTLCVPRQYPKKPRKSLLYQCFSSLERRLLHHNYTICERALM